MFKNIFLWSLIMVFCVSIAVQAAESINFWLMPNAPDDIHVPWLNEAVAEFKEQTGISVTYEIVGWEMPGRESPLLSLLVREWMFSKLEQPGILNLQQRRIN